MNAGDVTTTESLTGSVDVPHAEELFIGGNWATPLSDVRVVVTSPVTEKAILDLPDVSIADADAAVAAANEAFVGGAWSRLPMADRLTTLRRFRKEVAARVEQMNVLWAAEIGVPITVAASFKSLGLSIIDDAIAVAEGAPMTEVRETSSGRVRVTREPIGPVLTTLTYNGPLTALGMVVVPALAAGNCVIMKFPLESRLVSNILAECVSHADFPPGVVSVLSTGLEVSKHLVAHQDVTAVHFTGGTEAGADVAAVCAKRIAPVTLELGGKGAAIIAEDVDFDEVIGTLVESMVTLQGQVCVATTRVLVPRSRQDEFVRGLQAAFANVVIGDPLDAATTFGPLPSARIRARSEQSIAEAVQAGAVVAHGGGRPTGFEQGFYLEPTLLIDVTTDMSVAQNEIFGPVYCVMPYDGIDDAIRIANDTRYGLAGSVFTRDAKLAEYVADKIEVGAVAINGGFPSLVAPYGGVKQSGYGRSCGLEGLFELTRIKSVVDYSSLI